MLHRTPHHPTEISRRSHAQRRMRRSAGQRLFCSTNGCTTYLVPDEGGHTATCPVCGLRRRLHAGSGEGRAPHRTH